MAQPTYHIVTFGCQQNVSDSERLEAQLKSRGMKKARGVKSADHVIVNTCMIRKMAEDRVYGLVNNLSKQKIARGKPSKIIVTGCMVGMAIRDKSGQFLQLIRQRMPVVDEFLPIEEVGFDHDPIRVNQEHAWVPISNGCNNFCTFCVVPYTRGREVSRPFEDIIAECKSLVKKGYRKITLLGMNVNSYGSDLLLGSDSGQLIRDIDKSYFSLNSKRTEKSAKEITIYTLANGKKVKPVYVKHLGRLRIPTLFPNLLEEVAQIPGLEIVDFISSNPWDFSQELIDVIARNKNITRLLHFALQSGSDTVLKRMNRWYSAKQYLDLLSRIRKKVSGVEFSTDIIVGFCEESEKEFLETVNLVRKARFFKAYIARYSDRPMTAAHKAFTDTVSDADKKRRWRILEELINKPNLERMHTYRMHQGLSVSH